MASTQRSNIEVFFTVSGAARVKKAFQDLERQASRTALSAPRAGFDLANTLGKRTLSTIGSIVRSAGGIAPAFGLGVSAVKSLYNGLTRTVVTATALAVAATGIGHAFATIYDSTAELTSVVLALRAVNDEISKSSTLPLFEADPQGQGLRVKNSAQSRQLSYTDSGQLVARSQMQQSIKDFQFLNKLAHEHGISIRELGKDYATLEASAIGSAVKLKDIQSVTEGITDAALVLGRTPAEVHRANIALGQIASKGCHAPGTLILLADYSTKVVESVAVGDELMGPDGNPRCVLRLVHGRQAMFRVTPRCRGVEPFEVNLDHKLRLATALYGAEFTITVAEYLALPEPVREELFLINRHHINPHVGFDIEAVGEGEYFGFEIEGDHLYLDAQGFEHHNSVYAEELKGQLAEAIPGALPIAAKAYGVTVAEFNKMVKAGQVDSASFFAKFGKQLKEEYSGAAKAAAQTTRVAAGQLANAWFNAKVIIGSGDLDKAFMRTLRAATRLLQYLTRNGSFARFGTNLARALDPLISRFERAVDGGYDFNRVLNFVVGALRGLVGIVMLTLDVMGNLSSGIGNMLAVFRSYGVEMPSLTDGIRNLSDGFRQFTQSLATRQFSGNGYVDFFVGLYVVIESVVKALGRLVLPESLSDGATTLAEKFERAAHWMNQLAAAIDTLSTGQVSPILDDTGEGLLVRLIQINNKIRETHDGIKEAYALLSGEGVPAGADMATKKRFATRDKLGDLFAGRPNSRKTDTGGNELVSEDSYATLFKARDLFVEIITYLDENKDKLKDFFDGALSAMNGVLDAGKLIAGVFRTMGIDANVAYLAGFYYIINKILPLSAILKGTFAYIASSLGISTTLLVARFGVIAAILYGIAFIVAKIVSNWRLLKDEIGNIITLIGAGLTDGIAYIIRQMADLLSYIPVVGGKIQSSLNGFADKLNEGTNAARKNVYYTSLERTSQRQVENRGRDPYSDAGPRGFDAFDGKAFAAGMKEFMPDVLSSAMKTPGVTGQAATLGTLMAGGFAKEDTLQKIADLKAAERETLSPIDQKLFDSFNGKIIDDGFDTAKAYTKPVAIYLSTGDRVELRGSETDNAKFDKLAAETAKNRASSTPAWGN